MGSLGPGAHKVLFEPSRHLRRVWGLILNAMSPLLLSCWGFSFALGHGASFLLGSSILLSMAVQKRVAFLEFSQEKMSTHPCLFVRTKHLRKVIQEDSLVYQTVARCSTATPCGSGK